MIKNIPTELNELDPKGQEQAKSLAGFLKIVKSFTTMFFYIITALIILDRISFLVGKDSIISIISAIAFLLFLAFKLIEVL